MGAGGVGARRLHAPDRRRISRRRQHALRRINATVRPISHRPRRRKSETIMDNKERIAAIIRKVSNNSALPDADESLFDSGFLDSFALPDLVSELEREFGIKIPDSDLNPRKFESMTRIQTYLESRM